ncbi:SRPBCC family protein [Asticcacaulis sp. ZE23SCel15]|uniref:SRPBCC family protein n=1 Tax=Asticcacaulis sp. ZE23SCel15 TaxID=3059027 RepID=UPI00265D689F|nr:SRPBCC family protein [Asticcacaulis sp. ZE23SCel15]WKL58191.1 SRPBCC family protein [Asticcacaulis sp. ZE23SCel15]
MTAATDDRELVLTRTLDAPRHLVWRCWTEPELLSQWYCPKPWYVDQVVWDLTPGGRSACVMHGPDGEAMPQDGVFLEVIDQQKIVSTDAFTVGWVPSADPFMTAVVTFEDAPGGKTLYVARARHWSPEKKQQHEQMGFHDGWGAAADQLEALAKTL